MMKVIFALCAFALSSTSFASSSQYWDFGFISGQQQFYNLQDGVFSVYGKSLTDIRFSLGSTSSNATVQDYKILRSSILLLTEEKGEGYCSSYAFGSFKQNFKVKCSSGKLDTSRDEKYFTSNWSGKLASCYLADAPRNLQIYSAVDGSVVRSLSDMCGSFVLGFRDKLYSFKKAKEWTDGFQALSLIEVDIPTGQARVISSEFNSKDTTVEEVLNPRMAWDGRLLGFSTQYKTWYEGHGPGGGRSFYIFDLELGTHRRYVSDSFSTGFITNSGYFRTSDGDKLFGMYSNGDSGREIDIMSWDLRWALGCRASDYCPLIFSAMNNDVLYARAAHDLNRTVIAKFNPQKSEVETAIIPAGEVSTSAFNATTQDGINQVYYLDGHGLSVFDPGTMKSRTFLAQVPSDSRVFASDDQQVVLVWSFVNSKPLFSFYDGASAALIAEKTSLEGQYDCKDLSWIYALSVKVSKESRQAIIKCGSGRSTALVTF